VRRVFLLAAALCLTGGCGVPQELSKQAEEVHSVAAESALLAHEASEGSLDTFTREHAKALRKRLDELRPAIENPDLAQIAAKIDAMLTALADEPGDRHRAATLERVFEHWADFTQELAG
jgi:hypothetical protein